jgi:hypothetical protein
MCCKVFVYSYVKNSETLIENMHGQFLALISNLTSGTGIHLSNSKWCYNCVQIIPTKRMTSIEFGTYMIYTS